MPAPRAASLAETGAGWRGRLSTRRARRPGTTEGASLGPACVSVGAGLLHLMAVSWVALAYVGSLVVSGVMLFIIPRRRAPTTAIAWLLLIALVPVLGLGFYFLVGDPKLPRARRRRQAVIDRLHRERVMDARESGGGPWLISSLPYQAARMAVLTEALGALPVVSGNHARVITDYDEALEEIARDIAAAKEFVHVEYYTLVLDHATERVIAAMEAAARRGIKVRVLFDHLGSRGFPQQKQLLERLTAASIPWHRLLPLAPWAGKWSRPDLRNHRKIVIIDGTVAWAGSQNLVNTNYSESNRKSGIAFEELVVRLNGPVAMEFDGVFRADWYGETGVLLDAGGKHSEGSGSVACQVLPSGPAHPFENNLRVFNSLIHGAKERVVLTNPYFVPDESLLLAVTTAAHRGVDVVLITDESGDHPSLRFAQQSYYEALLEAGVRIFLHGKPNILHAKTMTVDDDMAIIGSSNLDMRSLHLNMEVSTVFYSAEVVAQVRAAEARFLGESRPLNLVDWRNRGLLRQGIENLARLTAAVQ